MNSEKSEDMVLIHCGSIRVDLFLYDLNVIFHCLIVLNLGLHLLDPVDNCGMISSAEKSADCVLRSSGHRLCQIHRDHARLCDLVCAALGQNLIHGDLKVVADNLNNHL